MKFKSCNLHFSWNCDLNFNIRDVEFPLYSFILFKSNFKFEWCYFHCVHCDFKFIWRDFDMDSLIFELQIVFYFQLFLSANVRHIFLPSSRPTLKGPGKRGWSTTIILSTLILQLTQVLMSRIPVMVSLFFIFLSFQHIFLTLAYEIYFKIF